MLSIPILQMLFKGSINSMIVHMIVIVHITYKREREKRGSRVLWRSSLPLFINTSVTGGKITHGSQDQFISISHYS